MSETFVDVTLADVGEGIVEAEIVEWLVAVGRTVSEDQPIVLISTDKAVVELPAPAAGILREHTAMVGETVAVGSLLARIESSTEAAAKVVPAAMSPIGPAAQAAADSTVVIAAPSTRLLARELNVDLKGLSGSGPQGRIIDDDVKQAASRNVSATINREDSRESRSPTRNNEERVPLRGVRLAVARATSVSWRDVPHITEFRQIDASKLQQAREICRREFDERSRFTYLPLFVKAAAVALVQHPRFNARLEMDKQEIVYFRHCNIGIATATESGLAVPVLSNVEHKSLSEIARDLEGLLDRARKQSLSVADTPNGTFTITNFGSYGTWLGTPIIRAPEVALAGFGRINDSVLAIDGAPVVRPVLPICAATDHRVNDGIHLAAFLDTMTEVLLNPLAYLAKD